MNESKFLTAVLTVAFCLVPIFHLNAQESAMTNDEVISLVKAGLSSDLILSKIRSGKTNFDLSTNSMIALKKAGVSDDIVGAMLQTKGGSPGYSESQPPAQTAGPAPDDPLMSQMPEPGIYLLENGTLTAIEPTIYSGSKTSVYKTAFTYGFGKSKVKAVVNGNAANLQVGSARPEFYFLFSREYGNAGAVMSGIGGFGATSPTEFGLITMKVNGRKREATLAEFSAYTNSTGASEHEIREFASVKIRPGLYKVTPKADLATGEYCFYYIGNQGVGNKLFDFGVKPVAPSRANDPKRP